MVNLRSAIALTITRAMCNACPYFIVTFCGEKNKKMLTLFLKSLTTFTAPITNIQFLSK